MNVEKMAQATMLIKQQVAILTEEIDALKSKALDTALLGWYGTREQYEAMDEVRKEIYELLERLNRNVLPEMMRDNNTKSITLDNVGRRFGVSRRVSCSIVDKAAGYKWLRENGAAPLITETVNASTLSSFAKNRIEKEGQEMPEGVFKVSIMDIMSATKV